MTATGRHGPAGRDDGGDEGDDRAAAAKAPPQPGRDAPESIDGAALPASYELARDELGRVVAALEEGGLSLDESLSLWERGQALARACETFLAGARARVEAVLADQDRPAGDEAAR